MRTAIVDGKSTAIWRMFRWAKHWPLLCHLLRRHSRSAPHRHWPAEKEQLMCITVHVCGHQHRHEKRHAPRLENSVPEAALAKSCQSAMGTALHYRECRTTAAGSLFGRSPHALCEVHGRCCGLSGPTIRFCALSPRAAGGSSPYLKALWQRKRRRRHRRRPLQREVRHAAALAPLAAAAAARPQVPAPCQDPR